MKSLSLFSLLILIGDSFRSQFKFAESGVFIVLKFTTVSRCILGDRRRGNLEHRRRGGESVFVELWSLICRLRSKDPTQRIHADRPTWLGRRGGWKGGGKPPSQGLQGAEPPGPNLFVRAF